MSKVRDSVSSVTEETKELISIPNLSVSISSVISEIVSKNSDADYNPDDPFATEHISKVTIEYYIERIKKYTGLENSTLIISLIYADRFCSMSGLILQPHNVHRILLACVLMAIKYNEDTFYANDYYAKVGGITQINELEYYIIKLLNFNLFVQRDLFEQYVRYLSHYLKKEKKDSGNGKKKKH